MTKETEKIVKTMKERMDNVAFRFEHNMIDLDAMQNELRYLVNEFNELRCAMYSYHLMDEEDFLELTHTAYDYRDSIIDKYI